MSESNKSKSLEVSFSNVIESSNITSDSNNASNITSDSSNAINITSDSNNATDNNVTPDSNNDSNITSDSNNAGDSNSNISSDSNNVTDNNVTPDSNLTLDSNNATDVILNTDNTSNLNNTKVVDSSSPLQFQRAQISLKKSNKLKSGINENENDEILECQICYGSLDRHDDIRLGCGCIIHLNCLVQWVKSNLEDREQMLGRLRQRQKKIAIAEDTNNEVSPRKPDSNDNTDNSDDNELSLLSPSIKVAVDEDEETLSLFSPNPELSINTDDNQEKRSNEEKSNDNDNELVEVIICPYYYNNSCKYKETIVGKADIDDKYFISISDLSFIINVQNSNTKWLEDLAKDGLSPRFSPRIGHEISQGRSPRSSGSVSPRSPRISEDMEFKLNFEILTKLRNWIEEDKEPPKILEPLSEAEKEESTMKYTIATTKPCPNCKVPVSHFHGHACHHIRYVLFYFLFITFLYLSI
jgi:hypothetical protein